MDLFQIEVFAAIAEERSFTRAAARVLRTQPALSLAMKRLERELGAPLFDRSRRGALTEAGEALLPYARRLLHLRDEAKRAVSELKGLHRGTLRLGANESTSLYLLPRLLLAYRRRHPRIKIEVDRFVSQRIPAELLERNLDLGFLSYEPHEPSLVSFVVWNDELTLVVAPSHRLAGRRRVSIRELGAETFLAHNAVTPARTRVLELFAAHATPLNISMELATLDTIQDFVARGAGAAILPRLVVADALAAGRLVAVRVREMSIEKPTRVVYRKGEALSPAARAFLELVRAESAAPAS